MCVAENFRQNDITFIYVRFQQFIWTSLVDFEVVLNSLYEWTQLGWNWFLMVHLEM